MVSVKALSTDSTILFSSATQEKLRDIQSLWAGETHQLW